MNDVSVHGPGESFASLINPSLVGVCGDDEAIVNGASKRLLQHGMMNDGKHGPRFARLGGSDRKAINELCVLFEFLYDHVSKIALILETIFLEFSMNLRVIFAPKLEVVSVHLGTNLEGLFDLFIRTGPLEFELDSIKFLRASDAFGQESPRKILGSLHSVLLI